MTSFHENPNGIHSFPDLGLEMGRKNELGMSEEKRRPVWLESNEGGGEIVGMRRGRQAEATW